MNRENLLNAMGQIDDAYIAEAHTKTARRHISVWRRAAVAAAVLLLCLVAAVPALVAADVAPAYEMTYHISPKLAQALKPVRRSCTDNGVRMEVVSARIEGDTAEFLVTMQDLEGDRIDGTTDLFDSYSIRDSYDSAATCQLMEYDEETRTATFSIGIRQMDQRKFEGGKVTFSVREFLSHKSTLEGPIPDVSLAGVDTAPLLQEEVDSRGGGDMEFAGTRVYLQPKQTALSCPAAGASLTAIGYIDGTLHVQMYYEDICETDNHGFLWLQKENGEKLQCRHNEAFWDAAQRGSYEEYCFVVPYEELSSYQLYGHFVTGGQLTWGDWQITFPMSDVK